MTETELDDHAYFQAIEAIFVGLRGAPFLLSPADWQVAQSWHQKGIPVALIRQTLEVVFARWRENGRKGRISGLRYCLPIVAAAWAEQVELSAPGRRMAAPVLVPSVRLRALAAAIPESLPQRAALVSDLIALGDTSAIANDPPTIEARLAEWDRTFIDSVLAEQPALERAALDTAVEEALTALSRRIPRPEIEIARERLRRQLVRQRLGLPVLSLFSPEAEAGDELP
jgi:hypothetical protein